MRQTAINILLDDIIKFNQGIMKTYPADLLAASDIKAECNILQSYFLYYSFTCVFQTT